MAKPSRPSRSLVATALVIGVAATIAGAGVPASAASESPPESSSPTARVRIGPRAKLLDGGTAVLVPVVAGCSKGAEVLEAFVTVSQENVSSSMGFFPLECDGRPHVFRAKVHAFEGTFQPGAAFGSSYVLVQDPDTGQTDSDGHSREITIVE